MSKSSRSARSFFTNAAAKLPSSKKDDLSSKQKKTSRGDKTERTGSEGNLAEHPQVQVAATPAQRKAATHKGKAGVALSFGVPGNFLLGPCQVTDMEAAFSCLCALS